jgi:NAD(P)-dependent dehydrogenase (short-subunit alcohol dehydrogenase family)
MSAEGTEASAQRGIELFSLLGEVALVTGGNGGLGRAMALGPRAAGATVAATGRDAAKNEAITKELGDPDAVFSLEVREEEAVERTEAGCSNASAGKASPLERGPGSP